MAKDSENSNTDAWMDSENESGHEIATEKSSVANPRKALNGKRNGSKAKVSRMRRHDDPCEEKIHHVCDVCGKGFASEHSVAVHRGKAHRHESNVAIGKCEICSKQCDSGGDLEDHVRTVHMQGKSYVCDLCPRTCWPGKTNLINHRRCHTGEKPFLCDTCGQSFATLGDMNIHKRIHTGEKPHSCSHCEKGFRKTGDLNRHVRRMHTRKGLLKCEICNKKLVTKEELLMHSRTHTGEKPFKCRTCGKGFSVNWLLTKHVRVAHAPGGPSHCDLCQKPYSVGCERKGHIRVKNSGEGLEKYKCEICGRPFNHGGSLSAHLRSHTGEKPFKCAKCDKAFLSASERARHVRKRRCTEGNK